MAGVNSKEECKDFDLTMTCCLGDHPLQEPKLLPCQHSFCSKCIKTKVKDSNTFICPKCQLSVPLTERGLSNELMKEPKVLFNIKSGIGNVYGLTVAENDDIVAVHASTIQVYNSEGIPIRKIQCGQLQNAWNVVAKGDALYISNASSDGNILVLDFDGNVKKTITLPQTGQNYSNKGLAVDDAGNVYISSSHTHTVYKCKHNETNAKVFIPKGKHKDLSIPRYLCMTPGGDVVVSNLGSHSIQVYDRQGEFMWQYKGQDDMAVSAPMGVCSDSEGHIYVADCNNNRIQVIKNGVFRGCIQTKDFIYLYCIAIDSDNHIVCGYQEGKKMMKIKVWE